MGESITTEPDRSREWWRWAPVLVLAALLLGYLNLSHHPPHPQIFNIEWDEEVQVAEGRAIWVHHAEIYSRTSTWRRWDARKVTEELQFRAVAGVSDFSYRLPKGVFRGIGRANNGFAVEYAEDIHYPAIGSCVPGEGVECYFIVRSDGSTHRPQNRNEVSDTLGPLASCRTTVEECYEYFNGQRISLSRKQAYFHEHARIGD
jgi:hypothetical protein